MQIGDVGAVVGMGAQEAAGHVSRDSKADKNAAYDQGLQAGMDKLQQSDPKLFAKIMTDGQKGDGNALVKDELQAGQEGAFTKQQTVDAVSGAQGLANSHGGGKINKGVRKEAEAQLGGSYIHGGQTRAGHAILKFLEDTSPLAQMIKGIKSKTSDGAPKENILQAGQAGVQNGMSQAMSDLANTDPMLAQQFAQDAKSGNGNAMAEDLVAAGQESRQSGGGFSDADASMLGSQIGNLGKGKVSGGDAKAFEAEFGQDTLDRGSSKASKGWDKFENGIGNFMGSLVSPVTDGVGAIDQFAKGNKAEGLKDLGGALMGAVSDAALVVAPEAAPELEGAEMAGRAGELGAMGAKGAQDSQSLLQTIRDGASRGYDAYSYGSNVVGMAENPNQDGGGGKMGLL